MIRFLFKGLLRDRSRSLFPILVVLAGVMLAVVLYSWIQGENTGLIRSMANFSYGHVRIMSRAYAQEADQIPNDLAFIGVDSLLAELNHDYPGLIWTPRIRFGGLLDVPDEHGETRSQGPVMGLAVKLLAPDSAELGILNLKNAVVRGRLPLKHNEVIITDEFAKRLGVNPGTTATLFSSTMYGSMATANFTVVGTVRFGIGAMDRGAMIADISDIQKALDMTDAAGEVIGFFKDFNYYKNQADKITTEFNNRHNGKNEEYAPVMFTLRNQGGLAQVMDMHESLMGIIIGIFMVAMSIVLWNAGLLGSLRRYGEFGMRLAIGEDKSHLYRSLIAESVLIGIIGSIAGTFIGLVISYVLQEKGINIAGLMKNSSMIFPNIMRAHVTPISYIIGFIPGILATILGAAISGLGIYRRQTARLVKELET